MKKVALAIIAIAFVAGVAFAQGAAEEAKAGVVKVVNVTLAEPAKGVANGTITVADDTGKAMEYTVTQSTKIIGVTLDAVTLNQLKIGEKITIKSKAGSKEVSSIKVVE
ncbi:MAG: hypothetical protein WC522_09020 [Candidatus Omnitrophota bacterium]